MPEKITIVKESGESVTSNVMSVFMIPETNKQYIITTENAVDPHGLTVLHVSEISENNLLKVQTDDEWSSIKTIMRAIISSSVGSYKYIPTITNANAKDLYSRDISVSAGAAKQLLDSYTNGPKEVAIKDDTIPERDPNAIESDSIFPTANVETDENAEIAPGLSTVEDAPAVEENVEPATDTLENAITDDQVVDVPIIDNNQIVETPVEEPATDTAAAPIPVAEPAEVAPTEEVPVETEPAVEIPEADGTLEAPVSETTDNTVPVEPTEELNIEAPAVDGVVPAEEAGVIPVAIPVLDDGVEVAPTGEDNLVPVEEETPAEESLDGGTSETTEEVVPTVDDLIPTEETPTEEPPVEETPVEDAAVEETPVEGPVLPEVETNKDEATVTSVVNANIDENTIKDALNEIVGDRIENTLNEKVSELLPNSIQENMTPAIENTLPQILGDKIKEPISESVESTLENLIEEKIQAPLLQTVTDTVNETIEKQAKALNSVGIKLDFGVESSFGQKASLDEIVAGAQELFLEGVKNLIMVMTERVYKELRIKEEELKKREVIVSQREQAVNDKTLAMMNGTYNPADYQTYTPAAPVAPEMGVPTVAPQVAAQPVAEPVPAVPTAPVTAPMPGAVPEVAMAPVPEVPTPVAEVPTPVAPEVPATPVPQPVESAPAVTAKPVPTTPVVETPAPAEVPPVDVAPVVPEVPATPVPQPVEAAPTVPVEPVPAVPTAEVPTPVPTT